MERHVLDGEALPETDPLFLRALEEHGADAGKVLRELAGRSSLREVASVPAPVKELFLTAHDVDPLDQVRVQAAFQAHVDNAVSKTINLRAEATVDDVKSAFQLAHRLGCKGLTVYREGSKAGQVLTAAGRQECVACARVGTMPAASN
jgi:ribonucleoside-diphosphate reductase alpha chain